MEPNPNPTVCTLFRAEIIYINAIARQLPDNPTPFYDALTSVLNIDEQTARIQWCELLFKIQPGCFKVFLDKHEFNMLVTIFYNLPKRFERNYFYPYEPSSKRFPSCDILKREFNEGSHAINNKMWTLKKHFAKVSAAWTDGSALGENGWGGEQIPGMGVLSFPHLSYRVGNLNPELATAGEKGDAEGLKRKRGENESEGDDIEENEDGEAKRQKGF